MTPLQIFDAAWNRCDELKSLHAYLAVNLTHALTPDELLRAEWVARVSALDLYVHELVCQGMVASFTGAKNQSSGFKRFQISNDVMHRIRTASTATDAAAAFDLEVRTRLGFQSYQDPDKIADGIRLISDIELWNELALAAGSTVAAKKDTAKSMKRTLSAIVSRRNKIAHEGDLQSTVPRIPYVIDVVDLSVVATEISTLVNRMNSLLA